MSPLQTHNALFISVVSAWCEKVPSPPPNIFPTSHILLSYAGFGRADERTRTADLLITSELLYLLSYVGLFRALSIPQRYGGYTGRTDASWGEQPHAVLVGAA